VGVANCLALFFRSLICALTTFSCSIISDQMLRDWGAIGMMGQAGQWRRKDEGARQAG